MNDFELLAPPKTVQTRASFPAVQDSVLGHVQVADEAGFAYLDGDIDFGATGANEIFQNIKYIVLTEYFSVPLDREFGMDYSMVDKPMAVAEAILSQEVAMKITLYEPRAQFREISFVRDEMIGKLSPTVRVIFLTTAELPSSLPPGTAIPAAVAGPPGVTIEEVDLPRFFETLIELARIPGPPGPIGLPGPAGQAQIWRGEYDDSLQYYPGDAVEHHGSSFLCLEPTLGNEPTPDTVNNVMPPLANTAHRGSVPPLPLSNQTSYWLQGDNTWQSTGAALSPNFIVLTDAVTIIWTLGSNQVSQNARLTLGGNRTLAFSGLAEGMNGTLIVKQDATGNRTLALPSGSKVVNSGASGVILSTAANAVDILTWIYDGTNVFWTYGKNYT